MIQAIGSIYTDNFYTMRNFYQPRKDIPRGASPPEDNNYVNDVIDLSPEAQAAIQSLKNE